jgi:hypothetical protein
MDKMYTSRKKCTQKSHYSYACMFKLNIMYTFKFKKKNYLNVITNEQENKIFKFIYLNRLVGFD